MTSSTIKSPSSIIVEQDSEIIYVDGKPEHVEPLLMRMLLHFYQNQGQLVTRQVLMEEVWLTKFSSDEAINIGVSRLRKILGGKRELFIKTLPRKGYQFDLIQGVNFEVKSSRIVQSKSDNEAATAAVIPLTTQDSNRQADINITANTSPTLTKTLTTKSITFITALILITVASFWWFNQASAPKVKAKISYPLVIHLNQTKIDTNNSGRSTSFGQSLHSALKSNLRFNQKLTFNNNANNNADNNANNKAANPFNIDITARQSDQQLLINVDIANKTFNIRHSSELAFEHNAKTKVIGDEIAAYIRLMLIIGEQHKAMLQAYNPLNYREVEQLIKARMYSSWRNNDNIVYAYDVVSKLNKKYPYVSQITGLLSKLKGLNVVYGNSNVIKAKQQQYEKAKTTLATDPANLDALLSAFNYHRDFAATRDQAQIYADAMINHHPNDSKSWRNQLLLMIDKKMSCDKMASFVRSIPSGLFKPHRVQVIEQILAACVDGTPGQAIYDQLNFMPNSKVDKAILNNLTLFQVNYDSIWLPDSRISMTFNGPKYHTVFFLYQAMRGDKLNANAYLQQIQQSKNNYWHWYAQLYLALHEQDMGKAAKLEQQLWQDGYYQLLHKDSEMLFAALHIKLQSVSQISKDKINQYFAVKPNYPITIMNRKENIAQIMLLHHAGKIEDAQRAANLLYQQFEQNFKQSPNSFRFWQLGRYHLISKLYCGQPCASTKLEHEIKSGPKQAQSQIIQQYFSRIFSQHHIYWQDDVKFMEQALKPWLTHPLAVEYLQKIDIDLKQMQQKQGIKSQ